MSIASSNGFIGGSNAAPEIAHFPMGATSRGGQGFLTGATAHTLDADSPFSLTIASPASAINQDLPTTGVLAGRQFLLQVTGATETNFVALRSSGGNEIDRIGGAGFILVEALISSPTTAAHWRILSIFEESPLLTGTSSGAVASTFNVRATRQKTSLHANVFFMAYVSQASATASATNTITIPAGTLPTRFRPSATRFSPTSVVLSNALAAGIAIVAAAGSLEFRRYDAANFSGTSGITDSINAFTSVSWIL